MKRLIKLVAILLVFCMAFAVTSCGKESTIDDIITIYNNTDHMLTSIVMATSEKELNSEDAIVLFDEQTHMNPKSANDYGVEFPEKAYKGTWFIKVVGTDTQKQMSYSTSYDLGEVFNTPDDKYTEEVIGFQIDFDTEKEMYIIRAIQAKI